jgi:hypothetical protein
MVQKTNVMEKKGLGFFYFRLLTSLLRFARVHFKKKKLERKYEKD